MIIQTACGFGVFVTNYLLCVIKTVPESMGLLCNARTKTCKSDNFYILVQEQ